MDGRTTPERIFDESPLFTLRLAGNVLTDEILHSLELIAEQIDTILVLGHTDCAAIKAALSGQAGPVTDKLQPAIDASPSPDQIAHTHVALTLEAIRTQSPLLASLNLIGAIYDVHTGTVEPCQVTL